MTIKQLSLGDVFKYHHITYVVSYIGKYGVTGFNLKTGIPIGLSFTSRPNCKFLHTSPIRNDADVKHYYPEAFL